MNSSRLTRWFIYILIIVAIGAILWSYNSAGTSYDELAISELAQQVKEGEIAELRVSGDGREVTVDYRASGRQGAQTQISGVSSLEEVLATYGVTESDYNNNNLIIK